MNLGWRTHLDGGGWGLVVDLIEYFEGSGYEDECERARRFKKNGANYRAKFTPSRHRSWQVTELQIVLVAIKSDEERFEIMAHVNPVAGVRIPCWIRANHGHMLEGANPMRTSLQLSCVQDFDTLKLVGSGARDQWCGGRGNITDRSPKRLRQQREVGQGSDICHVRYLGKC
jgi:hypothetical protein